METQIGRVLGTNLQDRQMDVVQICALNGAAIWSERDISRMHKRCQSVLINQIFCHTSVTHAYLHRLGCAKNQVPLVLTKTKLWQFNFSTKLRFLSHESMYLKDGRNASMFEVLKCPLPLIRSDCTSEHTRAHWKHHVICGKPPINIARII